MGKTGKMTKTEDIIRTIIPTIIQVLIALMCSSTGTTIVVVIIMTPINILGAILLWAVLMAVGIFISIIYNYGKEMIRLKRIEAAIEEERRKEERSRRPF